MSTLTKICVVLLVVVVLFACPIFIRQAVTGPNWMTAYMEQRDRAKIAEGESVNNGLLAQMWKTQYDQKCADASKTDQERTVEIERLKGEVDGLKQEKLAGAGREKILADAVRDLENDVKKYNSLNEAITKQLDIQRADNVKLDGQLREAKDSIKEYLADIENLTRANRVLKEQGAQKDNEIADLRTKLEAGGGAAESVDPTVAVGARKIEGEVTAVRANLASLNVGSADGVVKGAEFILFRGRNFVAHLRVAEVYASGCAGVIEDQVRPVKIGDKASNDLK